VIIEAGQVAVVTGAAQGLGHALAAGFIDRGVSVVVHGIQAFVPHLVTAGGGHVLNIASLAGLTTIPFAAAYCASKHAVVAISETLHRELEEMGLSIGVTVACPALVRTPMTEGMFTLAQPMTMS
jgi:short-subunit dehydrogenase